MSYLEVYLEPRVRLEPLAPQDSCQSLSLAQLLAPDVAFCLLRCDGLPAACGGVKWVGADERHVKRL